MEYVNLDYLVMPLKKPERELIEKSKRLIMDNPRIYLDDPLAISILVDYDFNVIQRSENYWAAKETFQKLIPCRRRQTVAEGSQFPPRIQLELTSVCNIQCSMCPTSEQFKRPRKHMERVIFDKCIDEIARFGIVQLQLCHIGESLLHPEFFSMMDYLCKFDNLGVKWVSTNGMILNKENDFSLLDSPLDFLNISLNATDKKSYDKICFNSDYDRVVSNIRQLIMLKKINKCKRPLIRLQMIDQPLTRNQLEIFLEEWGHEADMLSINKLESFAGQVSKNTAYSKQRLKKNNPQMVCKRLDRGDFYILSNGEVTICDTDFNGLISLGNVKDMSIKEMWDGPAYRSIREIHRRRSYNEIELCKTCTDWDL